MAVWPYNTTQWQRLREAKLAVNPTCQACERRGITVPAFAIDHIVAIAAGGPAFPALDGLMSLCESCHNSKTRRVDSADSKAGATPFKGCDVNGDPLWPDDAWMPIAATGKPADGSDAFIGSDGRKQVVARPRPSVALPEAPGALQSPQIEGVGPSWETKTDLVFANHSQLEADRWV